MAILFGRVSNVSRGSGNSAIKAAAYRSCSQLTLNATDVDTNITVGLTWDYSKKGGLAYSQIHAPEDAPEWVYDRQTLWQRVEDVETKSNARLAGEYTIALPKEFTTEQNIEFLKEIARNVFVSRGIVVDVNFHNDNTKNPHAHLMYALRQLEKFVDGTIDFATHRCRELQTRAFLEGIIKEEHKQLLNKHLIKNGYEERLEWGVVRGQEATIHHGGVREAYARNEQIIRNNADKIIADPTIVIDKLDFNKAVFTKENIASELEKALYITLKNTVASDKSALDIYVKTELVGLLDTVLLSPKLTLVNPCDLKGRMLFAKTSAVELEQRLVGNISDLAKNNEHALTVGEQDIAEYKKGSSFSRQQKEAIIAICNGHDLAVLEGWPGSGKSTVTKEIVRLYQKEGYNIVAAAPTNKAAQELEAKLGIKVHTTASLRMQWQYDRGMEKVSVGLDSSYYKDPFYSMKDGALSAKTLLVLDEASMLDVATSDYFVSEVNKSGAKLLALGDNNQNQAIGSKGSFARMGEMAGRNILSEVNRHQNKDEEIRQLHIDATSALCNYQVSKAISIYEQLGKINILDNEADKEQAIATEYVKQSMSIAKEERIALNEAVKKIVISAYTNEEIGNLNGLIRDSFKRAGVLGQGNKFISGGVHGNSSMVELAEGDRIIFTGNLKEKDGIGGVLNNELATVRKLIKVDEMGVGEFLVDVEGATGVRSTVIRTGEQGRIVTFRHGYAVTNHAVQGATVPYKIFSMDRYSGFEATLVGLTRHQIDCQIFAAKDTLENEVYKTKDLDVEAVRQEFQAMGYEYVQKFNGEGREYWQKEDVPLWKLGLGLLTSKRGDLSFAIDASYGHESIGLQKQLNSHQAQLEGLRVDLNGHEQELIKFETAANTKLLIDNAELTQFETFAKEHFKVTEDIVFDITEVMAAPERFSVSGASGNIHDLENHLMALKGGIHSPGQLHEQTSALNWSDLSKQDQNLLLWSYIDKEERAELEQHFAKSQSLKEEILDKAQDASEIWDKLKESGLQGHESLTGNFAVVKDYLAARLRVKESFEQQEIFNKQLSSAKIQRLLVAGIEEEYSLKLQFVSTDISSIDRAIKSFERQKAKSDEEQLKKDPEYRINSVETDRQIYLQDLKKNATFKEIISNSNLFVADILHSATEGADLHNLASSIETHVRETALAKSQRTELANKILANWHKTGDIDNTEKDNTQAKFSKITAQLNINYNTLQKHAGHTTSKHYFNKLANNSLGNSSDYQEIMLAIYKASKQALSASDIASLIKAHDGLCEHIELTSTHIEELKQDRLLVQNNLNSSRFRLKEIKTYQETEFPHFISTLYKEESGVVIAKFNELLKVSSDPTQLASVISNNPDMLGQLKARSLIAKIFGSDEKKAVDINLAKLGDRLTQYIKGKNEMQQLHQDEQSGKYVARLAEIDRELGALRAALPNHQEISILEDIGTIQSHILKDSEGITTIDRFSTELSKLLGDDKAQDALFSYQTKHNVFFTSNKAKQSKEQGASSAELKQELQRKATYIKNTQNSQPSSKPSLTFEEVRNGLNQIVVAEIFRQYAPIHNPDGKIQKRGTHISCGSLSMDLGNKLGLWKRFSDGTKGDIFSFVEKATGCSKFESLEIVANHAGIAPTTKGEFKNSNPIRVLTDANIAESQPRDEWVAHGVIPESIAEVFNPTKDLAFLVKKGKLATDNKITNTYEYRNIDNELLGFAVRIEESGTGNKKVLPVAYCHNEARSKSRWMSKGFSDNGTKPIYGLEKLAQYPSQPILIVEGEKTADAASKLFQDHTVISWMGGAQSVDRVDWSKLSNKIVTIWPDNDAPGISAAKNIAEHIDNHNGFSGLVSIVDTKQLGLPQKWDLADALPDHLAREQLDQIVVKSDISSSQGLGVFNLELMSQAQRSNRAALDSLGMLVETGRIDQDKYISKEIYHDSMVAIASKLNIDLAESDSFVSNIRSVQDEYRKLHKEYALGNQTEGDKEVGAQEQTTNDLVRDTSVLHQVQLGVNKLTRTHKEHIENTAKEEVAKMKQFGASDKEYAGSNMHKAITSNKWLETLVGKNEQQANAIKLKFTAKTIDEFLVDKASSSKECHEHLAMVRKYGIDEQAILKSFKSDPVLGADYLASVHAQLTIAENFATKYKAIIDEAKQWGYSHDDIDTTKTIIGMDERAGIDRLKEIRNAQLFKYIEDKFNSPQYAKPISKLDQMKERLLEQQNFLKDTYESLKSPENLWGYGNGARTLISGEHLSKNPCELNHLFKLADEIVEKNIMPEYVLCRDLGTTNHLAVLVGKTERTIDYYNFRTIPELLSQMRQDAKCVNSVFEAIEKEQATLADLHGNIKKLDIYNELLLKSELAHEQRQNGDLAKLKLVAETALISGTKTTESLVKELQQTTDLKATHKKLDQDIEAHHINSSLSTIEKEKQEAKSADQIINTIKKEQEFLAQLHGNLKYPERDLNITAQAKLANELKQEGLHDKLESITGTAIATGAKTESMIIKELQQTTDLKATHKKLDQDIEAHHINSNLEAITKEKQEAKTPDQVIDSLKKEQGFLTELHATLKYPEHHGQALSLSIQSAVKNEQDNVIGQLHKLSSFVQSKNFKTHEQMTKILKDTTDPMGTHKSLLKDYQDNFIKSIHKSLTRLDNGDAVKIDNHTMSCPVKFMEHLVKTRTNEFIPHHDIQQIHNQVMQQQKHLEMEKDMGGYSM